jgi:COMPASS component BRE2
LDPETASSLGLPAQASGLTQLVEGNTGGEGEVPPLYHSVPSSPEGVRFSWEDRSPYVLISRDGRKVTTDKGFRSARANVAVREGSWYWEFIIHRGGGDNWLESGGVKGMRDGACVRVGVGRRESGLSGPVGVDG